jgi:AcrR family transcriptional regulator
MTAGLRERKKNQTRELIAETARLLFRQHGFDAVTVDDVAAAADVSKKTVFNYFPTKEALVFHRADDREADLLAAVHDRGPDVPLIESVRALCLRQADGVTELRRRMADPGIGFFELVSTTPALQRRWHELNSQLAATVADALRAQAGADPDDVVADVVAGAVIGAQRALFIRLRQRARSEASDAEVTRAHRLDVNRVFDQLRDGLASYPS